MKDAPWWRSAVVYQIYPRSFADSDGDGIGDLRGIIDRVDHLARLGVDVVWLSPIYPSPQDDAGYDISDYENVDPTFGSLADVDELIAALHGREARLLGVEDARRAAMDGAIVARELDRAALGGEVPVEDGDAAARLQRLGNLETDPMPGVKSRA